MDRRSVLRGALGGIAALSLAPLARTAGETTVTKVTDKLALVSGAGGNVLVRTASGGQVLVDSGAAASHAALTAALGGLPGAGRVTKLFNTHWHSDQTGGNEEFGAAGTAIVAHEKTRAHLAVGYYLPAEDRYAPPLPQKALPTESFYTTGDTLVDGERVEYGYLLEAHTDGDIYVHFRDSNVIAAGDAISPLRDPELDWFGGGWLGGRLDSLDLLLSLGNAQTRFVPSYGPVIGRAEVQAERDLMLKLFEAFVEHVRKGESAEDMLAAGVMNGLGRTFADPMKFLHDAHRGFWAHHNTLSPDIV
jgi:glyoxylase-like metal-dependent hydrolase (beta-lactamase superfamily II)